MLTNWIFIDLSRTYDWLYCGNNTCATVGNVGDTGVANLTLNASLLGDLGWTFSADQIGNCSFLLAPLYKISSLRLLLKNLK
jgi:hypothetical protein